MTLKASAVNLIESLSLDISRGDLSVAQQRLAQAARALGEATLAEEILSRKVSETVR